jgi:isopenicillin N synthase-like dioxygenase
MELPVIDAATLDQPETIATLHAACIGTGFFYLGNHGIAPGLIAATLDQAHQFFALPVADRMAVWLRHSTCNRGYEPMQAQTLEAGMPPDLKEGFYIGNDLPMDHPRVRAGLFNQGPNQWPAGLPGFRPAMEAYFEALSALSVTLMTAMARSLGLPPETFDAFCDGPMAILRLLHYPPQPPNPQPGEKGCGAHTDWGCLTLLLQDDAGGLQVQVAGAWLDAPPIPGTYVVNIGDMFARWTNDLYRSTLHRVVNLSGRDRYSIPFFFEGRPEHEIVCLPSCVGDAAPRYNPTTVSGHLEAMYRLTYAA